MNAGHRYALLALACAVLASTARIASAERIVFESYVGARPAEADRVGVLVHAVLDRRGFLADVPSLYRIFREHAFRPGLVAPKFGDVLRKQTEAGTNAFSDSKFRKTADDLGKLIAAMRQNSLVLARDPKNRELALRAMVYYSLACGRLAEAGAPGTAARAEAESFARLRDDTMAEVIRSFPSKIITARAFGEEAELLYQRMREQLNRAGRGKLSVAVNDDDAVIYVNEVVHGTAKVDIGDLVPGLYRVLLQLSTGESRVYEVAVIANQVARLNVDWDVDSLFVVGDWVGFKFPTEKEHARESELVSRLIQQHTDAQVAATITIARLRGRVSVTATTYAAINGRMLRSGRVELAGTIADEKTLDRLVDYMMGNPNVAGVTPVEHPEYTPPSSPVLFTGKDAPHPVDTAIAAAPPTRSPVPTTDAHATWPSWAAAGGSVGLLAVGGFALYKHYDTCSDCERSTATAIAGFSSLGAGIALGALATYWFLDTADGSSGSQVVVAPTGNGFLVGWGHAL